MARQPSLNTSDKVTMRDFLQFQNEIDKAVTRDLNRSEDKIAEAMEKAESRHSKFMEAMEARLKSDREEFAERLKADREAAEARLASDRREFASQKRWLVGIFATSVGIIGVVIYSLITLTNAIVANGVNPI